MSTMLPGQAIQAIRNRRGLLWICQRHDLSSGQEPHDYSLPPSEAALRYRLEPSEIDIRLASLYWEGIWLEGASSPLTKAIRQISEHEPSMRRRDMVTLVGLHDAQAEVSQEFLPVCILPGILDPSVPLANRYGAAPRKARERIAWDLAIRLSKYRDRALAVLGVRSREDVSLLYEVLEGCPVLDLHLILVCPELQQEFEGPNNAGVDVVFWTASEEEFLSKLESSGAPQFRSLPERSIRYANTSLVLSARDVQHIEKRFSLISEQDLQPPEKFSMDNLQRFLRGDLADWSAFALGVPIERAYQTAKSKSLEQEAESALSSITEEGEIVRTYTIRIPCEPGSGATTAIRAAGFAIANKGYPVLVLRPDQIDIDLEEILAFATTLNEASLKIQIKNPLPLLLILDVEHEAIPNAALLADYLASHGRSAVIVQLIPHTHTDQKEIRRRRSITLRTFNSVASSEEIRACAKNFKKVVERWELPINVPSEIEWSNYATKSTMQSPNGQFDPPTMFWIALRFFLVEGMQFIEADKALDALGLWIKRRCKQIEDSRMQDVVTYVAAFSAFRIVSPLWTILRPITGGVFEASIVSSFRLLEGIVEWGSTSNELHDQVLRFIHPALAREYLRQQDIRSDEDIVTALTPLLNSLSIGHPGDVWTAEILAASVLTPAYEQRQQRVQYDWRLAAFNAIPPALRDQSKTILHHWARCLYLSVDPQQVDSVEYSVQGERIAAAIKKLEIAAGLPRREGRDEHPSHIYNTLGTAYSRYARYLENTSDTPGVSEDAWDKASGAFRQSISMLPNIEALLAFSHRLLLRARVLSGDTEPTKERIGFVVEALSLLDQAEELLADHSNPKEEWASYLHSDRSVALSWLNRDLSLNYLNELRKSDRPDLAVFCEARLAFMQGDPTVQLDKALSIIESAYDEGIMPGSALLAFQLTLLRRHPAERFDFELQEEIYAELLRSAGYIARPVDRFRYAVLCYQTGKYREGERAFQRLREELRRIGGPQLSARDIWRDNTNPEKPRVTHIRVTRIVTDWRAQGYVEDLGQDIPLRPRHFTPMPKVHQTVSCIIRFVPNGPLAVPPRFEEL